jgi:asparagine synthase (glutamine-hydrolysing)
MCGFIGVASKSSIDNDIVNIENQRIICRGPDETKKTIIENTDFNLNLIFNRLSILELNKNGSQPLVDQSNNYVMMFNGEIFNYLELKDDLKKYNIEFKTQNSDSEVLFYGLMKEGKDFINRLVGQFSIVFIDKLKNEITLIRDRTGQKPLFFSLNKNTIYFGSNLISVSNMSKNNEINQNSLEEFLNLGVVTSPNTLYDNVFKVKPGEVITFNFQDRVSKEHNIYWNPSSFVSEKKDFSSDEFNDLLANSIELRLRSDVPLAAFCSGGLDSTYIIKKLHETKRTVPTFSVINKNPKYDERKYINQVLNKYKNEHFIQEVDTQTSFEDLLNNISMFDEPYMDTSNIPSSFISKEISKKYKVAISGDGGDEIFFGYKRFQDEFKVFKANSRLIEFLYKIYPSWFGSGNKILKHSKDYQRSYLSYFKDDKFMNFLGIDYKTNLSKKFFNNTKTRLKNVLILENRLYLSEMMNLKVDRTSMMHSVEVRSPFIDHRLIEYILSCSENSLEYKQPKKIIKDYLKDDFDTNFLNRKKMGFAFDVQNIIYNNEERILELIDGSNLNLYIPNLNIKRLFLKKSMVNCQRIYKLLILVQYV